MPSNVTTSQGQQQVLTLNDFTQGIFDNVETPTANSTTYFNRAPIIYGNTVTFTHNTYGVMGLVNGGLLLGPSLVNGAAFATQPNFGGFSFANNQVYVTGVVKGAAQGAYGITISGYMPTAQAIGTELYSALGPNLSPSGAALAFLQSGSSIPSNQYQLASMPTFPFRTLLSNGTNFEDSIIFTCCQGSANNGIVYYNVAGTGNMLATTSRFGFAIPANGRVWFCEGGVVPRGPFSLVNSNVISFTDPTLAANTANLSIGTQATLVDYDDTSTFGAWGAISSSESLLVKSTNGGIIVSGDIFNPTISRSPAVQGTNGLQGQSAMTPIGLVYRSMRAGVWSWDGGSTATKLSTQINDANWPENSFGIGSITGPQQTYNSAGPFFNVQVIRNCIFFDGGWFLSLDTNSWWRLPPWNTSSWTISQGLFSPTFYLDHTPMGYSNVPSSQTGMFTAIYMAGVNGLQLFGTTYAFDMGVTSLQPPALGTYYHSYIETNPIQLDDGGAIVEVQEMDVVMQGNGALTVSILGIAGAFLNSRTVPVNNSSYGRISIVLPTLETDVLILQFGWTNAPGGNNPTPIIQEINVYWRQRFPVPRI